MNVWYLIVVYLVAYRSGWYAISWQYWQYVLVVMIVYYGWSPYRIFYYSTYLAVFKYLNLAFPRCYQMLAWDFLFLAFDYVILAKCILTTQYASYTEWHVLVIVGKAAYYSAPNVWICEKPISFMASSKLWYYLHAVWKKLWLVFHHIWVHSRYEYLKHSMIKVHHDFP